jgi:hypothetical protein
VFNSQHKLLSQFQISIFLIRNTTSSLTRYNKTHVLTGEIIGIIVMKTVTTIAIQMKTRVLTALIDTGANTDIVMLEDDLLLVPVHQPRIEIDFLVQEQGLC